ncbi:MAG: sulfurtransferase [Alphaproteobacteria bacterium]
MNIRIQSLAALLLGGLLLASPAALAGPAVTPLVTTEWLEDNLDAADLLILDIRSLSEFELAQIPGSEHSAYPGNWNTERDGIPSRIPLTVDLEAYLSSIGIGPDISVVLVPAGSDSTEIGGATWIYWVLKYLGHDGVAILDGGWAAWDWDSRPTTSGPSGDPVPREFVASVRPELLAETADVAAELDGDTVIIDARPPGHYTGVMLSGLVTRAGHIPGAISLDNAKFYDSLFNRLKFTEELQAELPAGLEDRAVRIISYCVAGHWGSINWFVLHELLGFQDVRLYEGSMAAWSRDETLAVVLGPDPR